MKPGRKKTLAFAAAAGLALAPALAAERPHFDASRNDGAITIDGRQDDWRGSLQPFGSHPVSMQVANDGEFFYMRLASSDPGVRMELTRLGLTVWFDPNGGTKKVLGIRYPVLEQGHGREGRGEGELRRGGEEREAPETFAPPDRVDILGPGKDDARSLTKEHLQGVEVAMVLDQGTAMYELKVPLVATPDRPYAIAAAAGKTIGVGIETAKFEMPSGREGGRGGMGGGMGGGRRGGGGGYGGGRGGEFQPPKQVKDWATVTLK